MHLFHLYPFVEDDEFDVDDDFDKDHFVTKERHPHSANAFDYSFGDVYQSKWYKEFLESTVHNFTYYLSSRDHSSEFRCHFHLPLAKVDNPISLFVNNGWIY